MAGWLFAGLAIASGFASAEKIYNDTPTRSVIPHNRFLRGKDSCNSNITTIPDNDARGITSTLTITESGKITAMKLALDIIHPYVADLSVSIQSPKGTKVTLMGRSETPDLNPIDCGGANLSVVFDDAAPQSLENTCNTRQVPTFNGNFRGAQNLSVFNGEERTGTWTLTVVDGAESDGGTLDNWCLILSTANDPDCLIKDLALDTGNARLGIEGECGDFEVWMTLNNVDSTLGNGTVSGSVDFTIPLIEGATFFVSPPGDPTKVLAGPTAPVVVVPTLGEWSLIFMITMVMGCSLYFMKRNRLRIT